MLFSPDNMKKDIDRQNLRQTGKSDGRSPEWHSSLRL